MARRISDVCTRSFRPRVKKSRVMPFSMARLR